jgi:gamma-glutamyltranspeptidase / glutathione hydrolase
MKYSLQFERNPVFASSGAVATSHPAASTTALDVLKRGGNAMDAALAAVAALCVIEPAMTGIGGDCFAIYADGRTGKVHTINGSGAAPAAVSVERLLEAGISPIEPSSPHSVTIPGAIDAWCRLWEDFGSLELEELFRPAITFAEDGFPVHSRVAWDWSNSLARLKASPTPSDVLLPGGTAPKAGDMHRQPALGRTLRRIAREGRRAFYEGEVAEEIANILRSLGGTHTLEDFAAHGFEYVDTVETDYHGVRVLECPPNGQGIVALLILRILRRLAERFPVQSEADRVHLLAEATKLAYGERDRWLADPRFSQAPIEQVLSASWADTASSSIGLQNVGAPHLSRTTEHKDTTYVCVVDKDRNAVSFINSLFQLFGSTIFAPKSGVVLHNRGSAFQVNAASPNAIAGGKRPMHTLAPGLLMRGDRPLMPFGVMGGHYQAAGHAQLLYSIFERGMRLQEAVNHPRSFASDGRLRLEPLFSEEVVADLTGRGHDLDRPSSPMGGAQCIWIDHDGGVLIGASDPRKDGCALGY